MIQEIIMYQAVCDKCGKVHVNPVSNAWRWKRKEIAFESATSWDWIEIDNKLYCPECVKWDTETKSYKPKEKKNTKLSNSENIGKNLKPFDLEAAKQGKAVCTKNGKKARIICFDAKGVLPIIALVESGDEEKTVRYSNSGRFRFDGMPDEEDLIMLTEKKEGWINVYDNRCYNTKEEAMENKDPYAYYMTTVKVSWEE